jgi:hypothetical protein
MAVIPGRTTFPQYHGIQVQWVTAVAADTFGPSQIGVRYPDKGVTVQGTFNGATVLIVGSYDGTNYHTLHGQSGLLAFAAAGQDVIVENCPYIGVTHSGGGGSESITVTVVGVSY